MFSADDDDAAISYSNGRREGKKINNILIKNLQSFASGLLEEQILERVSREFHVHEVISRG